MQYIRGFALNSTHFNRTEKELRYGDALARSLGKHYVVNTAENANGSLPKRKWGKYGSAATTCNPRNAGLGTRPTTRTGSPYADAFLWISRPGLSSEREGRQPPVRPQGRPHRQRLLREARGPARAAVQARPGGRLAAPRALAAAQPK